MENSRNDKSQRRVEVLGDKHSLMPVRSSQIPDGPALALGLNLRCDITSAITARRYKKHTTGTNYTMRSYAVKMMESKRIRWMGVYHT
jgi:hypothetical protein